MNVFTSLLAVGLVAGLHLGNDAPQLGGVRLEMAKARVHAVLKPVADYKSQDENQEVWILRNDPGAQLLIVGYAPDDHVRYVTELPRPQGKPLACKALGDIKKAKVVGSAEDRLYTRSWKEDDDEFSASAREQAGRLTSCSIKKLGIGIENEEEEHAGRKHG